VYQVYSGIYAGSLITSSHGNQVEPHHATTSSALTWKPPYLTSSLLLPYFQVIEWFGGAQGMWSPVIISNLDFIIFDPLNAGPDNI
jgi:hypothetical protein